MSLGVTLVQVAPSSRVTCTSPSSVEAQISPLRCGDSTTLAQVAWISAPALSRVIALRLHLDDSTAENGPLRVIPGSHALGVLSDDEVFAYARTREAADCVARRGAVVAMRPLIIHASSKARGSQPRRVLHVEYADALELKPGVRLAVA